MKCFVLSGLPPHRVRHEIRNYNFGGDRGYTYHRAHSSIVSWHEQYERHKIEIFRQSNDTETLIPCVPLPFRKDDGLDPITVHSNWCRAITNDRLKDVGAFTLVQSNS
jgi:hypothetical protein